MATKLIGRLPKNAREEIRIELTEWRGAELAAVRIYFENELGEWIPTKKGVTFRRSQLADIIDALQAALNAAEAADAA